MAANVATLTHADSGATAQVLVSQGFNCFRWQTPHGELLYAPEGFETGEGRASSGGIPLLFPFPGRIQSGRFTFEGKEHQVPEGDGLGNALHGFVFTRAWRVINQSDSRVTAVFQGSVDAPETLEYWPADYLIRVTYCLEALRLVCKVRYENPSGVALPCGFGTHAYFRVPVGGAGAAEEAKLTVPVDAEWLTEGLIPTGKTEQNEATSALPSGLRLSDWKLDSVFQRSAAAIGDVQTSVASSAVKITQTCDARFGCYVIYTPPHGEAVCIEPYTCVPNPFGLGEQGVESGLTVLGPGEHREHTLTLEVGNA